METIALPTFDGWAVVIACAFIVADLVSGFAKAGALHDFNSTKMREGLYHKGAILGIIALAWLTQWAAMHVEGLPVSLPLVMAACGYVIFMECASIYENLCEINPELKASKFADLFKLEE